MVDAFDDMLGISEPTMPAVAGPLAWPETVTTADLADLLGISTRMVTQLAQRGTIRRLQAGVWPARESVRSYCAHLRDGAAGRTDSTSLTAERVRVATAQADALEMKNAVARRLMIPAREVESEWSSILRGVRVAVLAIPSRVQQRLHHLTSTDVAAIDREIRDALTEIADNG